MFGRKKDHRRRHNILFVIFRLILSLLIFAILLGGVYSAYKQFSGVDPVKLSPKALISNFTSPEKLFGIVGGLFSLDIVKKAEQNDGVAGEAVQNIIPADNPSQPQSEKPKPKLTISVKFAVIADSHNDNNLLAKALAQAKEAKVQFIIGLGDYTEVGTVKELQDSKHEFDLAGIRYFLTAGDHDLWDSRNKNLPVLTNFNQVFGSSNQAFSYGNARVIIMDNSDNYTGFGENQLEWLNSELDRLKSDPAINAIFIAVHESLYHPSSTRAMGKVTPSLKDEASKVIKMARDAGIKEIFSGDIHYFTEYKDPEGLEMTTIGAVTAQRNTQNPRFGIVTVYEDGSFRVEDVEIK